MNDMKRDLIRIQELVGMAFSETGSLVALADGGQMSPNKLQKTPSVHFSSLARAMKVSSRN